MNSRLVPGASPSSAPRRRTVAAAVIFAALVAILLVWANTRPVRDLSERPPLDETASPPPVRPRSSDIGALLTVPMDTLSRALDTALPRTHSESSSNDEEACMQVAGIGRRCFQVRYSYDVRRGDLSVTAADHRSLRLSTDVVIEGRGGPEAMGFGDRPFHAAARIDAVVTPVIGADWCPTIDLKPSYRWLREPRIEVARGVRINVSRWMDKALTRAKPAIVEAARRSVDCARWRARLEAVYGTRSFALQVAPGQPLHLNLRPQGFALSDIDVDDDGVRVAARMTVLAELETAPVAIAPLPLPPMTVLADARSPPRTHVTLPLRVPFKLLEAQASARLVGRSYSTQTPAGPVNVSVDAVHLYPTTGGRVAIGVRFSTRLPARFLDTRGTVYLVGTPALDGTTIVRLQDPTFTRALDNQVWSALSSVLESQIRSQLAEQLRYDLAGDVQRGRQALARVLSSPTGIPGARLDVSAVEAGLGRIAVHGADLVADIHVSGDVSLVLDSPGLLPRR